METSKESKYCSMQLLGMLGLCGFRKRPALRIVGCVPRGVGDCLFPSLQVPKTTQSVIPDRNDLDITVSVNHI